MRVAVTGATGLVGSRVVEVLSKDHEVVRLDRSEQFDLAHPDAAAWNKATADVDAILHLAARTDVDGVERERPEGSNGNAWKVNVDGTKGLTALARERKTPLILVSTDFVFPNAMRGPFPERASPTQRAEEVSWYGWTKLHAERAVLEDAANSILRISYPYRGDAYPRSDHARRLLDLLRQGKLYPLFTDQEFTPTFIDDAARALDVILRKRIRGILHSACPERVTPHAFGERLVRSLGVPAKALPKGRFEDAQRAGRAPRPQHGGLSTRTSQAAGIPIRSLDESLREFANAAKSPAAPVAH